MCIFSLQKFMILTLFWCMTVFGDREDGFPHRARFNDHMTVLLSTSSFRATGRVTLLLTADLLSEARTYQDCLAPAKTSICIIGSDDPHVATSRQL